MKDLQCGQFVRVWPTSRIGMVMKTTGLDTWLMFVNNGPLIRFVTTKLIPATRQQIIDAGLDGIGCVGPEE